jgi:hypothetical protein
VRPIKSRDKVIYANNDKAKSWQKWNGKIEELRIAPFNSRRIRRLTSPAETKKGK